MKMVQHDIEKIKYIFTLGMCRVQFALESDKSGRYRLQGNVVYILIKSL